VFDRYDRRRVLFRPQKEFVLTVAGAETRKYRLRADDLRAGGVGVLVSEVPALREYWYPVGYGKDVGPTPQAFRVFGEDYVVWRPSNDAAVLAAVDECPHRGARLSQGWVSDGCLTCPYHGWRFDGSGACVEIPASDPGVPIPSRAHVHSILVGERYGLVWVCVGVPRAPIPLLPEAEDLGYTLVHELIEIWSASAPRIIDNALDVSHVAWVHRNSVGTDSAPRLSDFAVERNGTNLRFSVSYLARVNEQQKRNTGLTTDFTTRTTHAELVDPLVFRGVLEYPENGLIHVLFKTATPVDDTTTMFCQFIARNDDPDAERQAGIIAVDRQVQSEDRVLLEGINPEFPLEATTEVHTKSDRMTLEYRRVLADLAAETSLARPDRAWARRARA
jgi:phenylpropionate dioxygenase-like ring-hydroxylating dioxygenase large terminal subunit